MIKKIILYVIIISVIIFTISWVGSSTKSQKKEAPSTINALQEQNSYQRQLSKDMDFVFLEYMNDDQVKACNDLYSALHDASDRANYQTFTYSTTISDFVSERNIGCEDYVISELLNMDNDKFVYFYSLPNEEMLLMAKKQGEISILKYFDPQTCEFEHREFLVSPDNFVAEIDNQYYLISKWFHDDRYVFYYLTHDETYDEVNCRFNVVNDLLNKSK